VSLSQHRRTAERLILALLLIALAAALWTLRAVVLTAFAAVLVALLLSEIARLLSTRLRLPRRAALAAAVVIALSIPLGAAWLFGREVSAQLQLIVEAIPRAIDRLGTLLDTIGAGDAFRSSVSTLFDPEALMRHMGSIASSSAGAAVDLLLVIFGGIYFAAQPLLYRTGLVKLVPPRSRARAGDALDNVGVALRRWLLGQLAAMALVGLLTGIGLLLLGSPSALALGVLAALLEFIPYLGPILSAVPAIAVALVQGPEHAAWVTGLYSLVQQIENHLIQPLIQQQAVDIPPALLLFGVAAMGTLFGIPGVVLAAPLAVMIFVLVKQLYVREALHTPTPLPSEQ
jgi:predicted PurR-regulated permease PerM